MLFLPVLTISSPLPSITAISECSPSTLSDGTKNGFEKSILKEIVQELNIPVIASGGAGSKEHFKEVFEETNVSAALAASVFHFGEITIPDLKKYLNDNKIYVRTT